MFTVINFIFVYLITITLIISFHSFVFSKVLAIMSGSGRPFSMRLGLREYSITPEEFLDPGGLVDSVIDDEICKTGGFIVSILVLKPYLAIVLHAPSPSVLCIVRHRIIATSSKMSTVILLQGWKPGLLMMG